MVSTKSSKHGEVYYGCSESCISFAAYGLCAHVLAVAELDNNLDDYLKWYKKVKQTPANVTALAEMDLPSSRGTKKTKATQIRKGEKNTNKRPRTVVENYIDHGEIPSASIITSDATTSCAVTNATARGRSTTQVDAVAAQLSTQTQPVVSLQSGR